MPNEKQSGPPGRALTLQRRMDRLPADLPPIIWKMRFQHVPLAVARSAPFTKEWRDARLCCKQAAAAGKYVALLFAPNDVFIRSLDLKARLALPTRARQLAAMVEVQETNGRRQAALFTGPCGDESEMDTVMRRKGTELYLVQGILKALCHELQVAMSRPWSEEHLKLVIVGFSHYNARLRSGIAGKLDTAPEWSYNLSSPNLMAYIKSYEEMITQTEERAIQERAIQERFFACPDPSAHWIAAALDNCG